MADDLSLLFKIRGDAAGAKTATAEARAAAAQLRQSFGPDLAQGVSLGNQALSKLSDNLNVFVSHRVPLIGGAFVRITENLRGLSTEASKNEKAVAAVGKSFESLAAASNKTVPQIANFLTHFVQIEGQANRDSAAISFFGAKLGAELVPQLEKTGEQLAVVSTQSVAMSGAMAGVATPVGAAVVAAAAMVVGLGVLGNALFQATKSAADFQGKLFDLSQQTGVSVETLSTLEYLARKTGSNLDSMTSSLVLFQTKMEDAQDSTSEAGKIFAKLGIETNNTEESFRQAVAALAKMDEGFIQTNTAAELFGRRGAKQVLAILKESHGDIDLYTEKLREAGVLITGDVARAADEFNDTLLLLQMQLRALGAIIGTEMMPLVLDAVMQVSKGLKENREALQALASIIKLVVEPAVVAFTRVIIDAANVLSFASQGFRMANNALVNLAGGYDLATAAAMAYNNEAGRAMALSLGATGAVSGIGPPRPKAEFGIGIKTYDAKEGGGRGGGRGGGKKTSTTLQEALKEAQLIEKETLALIQANVAENDRALNEQVRSIEEFTARAIDLDTQRLVATLARLDKEEAAQKTALSKKQITQKEFDTKERELRLERFEAVQKSNQKEYELERDRDRKISEAQLAARQRQIQIAEDADKRMIDAIKRRVDLRITAESEGEKEIAAIEQEAFARIKKALEAEEVAYATTLERRAAIIDELIRLEGERAGAVEKASQRIIDAQMRENVIPLGDGRPIGGGKPRIPDSEAPAPWLGALVSNAVAAGGAFQGLGVIIQESLGLSAEYAATFGNAIAQTFGQIGEAVGSAVRAFVLFGGAQGSFKKFAAEVIASVAQMAVVQAVFELAQGLAMLALNFFFPNPKYALSAAAHFQAAAVFGAIGVGAALVGRAVAGNAFQSASGGGASGGGGGSAAPNAPPTEIDVGRRKSLQPETITQTLELRVKGDAVIEHWERDYMLNGRTRVIVRSDGGN